MATVPLWATGKHITSIVLTPQTVNSVGVLADSTPVASLFGHLKEVEVDSHVTSENITPMNSTAENQVPLEYGTTVRLTELDKQVGSNLLADQVFTSSLIGTYVKYQLTRGGQAWTGYGLVGDYKMSGSKPGVNSTLEIRPIQLNNTTASGYATANPTYA